MARKKSDSSLTTGEDKLDVMIKARMEDTRERWGDKLQIGAAGETRVLCMPVPFALKLLFQLPGLPLGRFMTIVGPPESCKSALGYEFCRLHRVHGGGYSLIETEDKNSTALCRSIVGYDDRRSTEIYVETMEEWMSALNEQIKIVIAAMDEHTPPRSVPWAFLVDSLSGVTTQKISDDITESGTAKLVQPQGANLIANYMKPMPHWLTGYPGSIIAVNHLKLAADSYGNMSVRKLQGGYAPRFHESIEVEMRPIGKQAERREPRLERYRKVGIRVAKNSLAQHSPDLEVEMVWTFEPMDRKDASSPVVQRTIWDWYTAAINYLMDPEDLDSQSKKAIREALDIKPSKKDKKLLWSETLGVPESKPVNRRVMGLHLERHPEVQEKLYQPCGIRTAFVFRPGIDIVVQRQEAMSKILRLSGDICDYGVLPLDPQQVEEPAAQEVGSEEVVSG